MDGRGMRTACGSTIGQTLSNSNLVSVNGAVKNFGVYLLALCAPL